MRAPTSDTAPLTLCPVCTQAGRLSAQEAANTLFAYATLRLLPASPGLLQLMCEAALRRRHDTTPQVGVAAVVARPISYDCALKLYSPQCPVVA